MRNFSLVASLCCTVLLVATSVDAQTDAAIDDPASATNVTTAPANQVAPPMPVVQQQAVDALSMMGQYLRTLSQFEVTADSATEAVLDSGPNATFFHRTVLKVRRPSEMRAEISGTYREKGLVYDGRHFTIFSVKEGYYSTNPALPTLDGLVRELSATYNIEVPLVDLFYWGSGTTDDTALSSAQFLGLEKVDTRWCNHYVYRQSGADWELWLGSGRRPLPCRLSITDTSQESRPTHSVTYHWNLQPSFSSATFVFRPSAHAHPIVLKPAGAWPKAEAQ